MHEKPEDKACKRIDQLLTGAGWVIQDTDQANVAACRGVAIREFPLNSGYGFAD
jgi:type I restriction enzyme R subunit